MPTLLDSPLVGRFLDGAPLSSTALNALRDAALDLNELTRLGAGVFQRVYGQAPELAGTNPCTLWRGGFVWLTGMTTLRVTTTSADIVSGDTLRVYRGDDNTTVSSFTLADGVQEHEITISSGYTDGQVVRVRAELYNAGAPAEDHDWGTCAVTLVEALPVGLADAYPYEPTFATIADITAAKLTQLAQCIDWQRRLLGLRVEPLQQAVYRRVGPYEGQTTVRLDGTHRHEPAADQVVARGAVQVRYTGKTEAIRLFVDGVEADSYTVPTTVGETTWELTADLSGKAEGDRVLITVDYVRTVGGGETEINTWTVEELSVVPAGGSPAALTDLQIRAFISHSDLLTWLADLAGVVTGTFDAINGNEARWSIQTAYTARHAQDDYQYRTFEPWCVARSPGRVGQTLVTRGSGSIQLGSGPQSFGKDQNEVGAQETSWQRTDSLTSGEDVVTGATGLESVDGLAAGAPFVVRGERLYYVAERLLTDGD